MSDFQKFNTWPAAWVSEYASLKEKIYHMMIKQICFFEVRSSVHYVPIYSLAYTHFYHSMVKWVVLLNSILVNSKVQDRISPLHNVCWAPDRYLLHCITILGQLHTLWHQTISYRVSMHIMWEIQSDYEFYLGCNHTLTVFCTAN